MEDSQGHVKTSTVTTLVNTAHLHVCLFTTANSYSPAKPFVSGPRKRNTAITILPTLKKPKGALITVHLRSQIRNFDFFNRNSDSG